jgi:hypothetical protein
MVSGAEPSLVAVKNKGPDVVPASMVTGDPTVPKITPACTPPGRLPSNAKQRISFFMAASQARENLN